VRMRTTPRARCGKVCSGFPLRQTQRVCAEIMLNQKPTARNQEPPLSLGAAAGALGAWRNASGARVSTPSARHNLEPRELKHKIEILPGCSKPANEATNASTMETLRDRLHAADRTVTA
jgi:hypothetical protein